MATAQQLSRKTVQMFNSDYRCKWLLLCGFGLLPEADMDLLLILLAKRHCIACTILIMNSFSPIGIRWMQSWWLLHFASAIVIVCCSIVICHVDCHSIFNHLLVLVLFQFSQKISPFENSVSIRTRVISRYFLENDIFIYDTEEDY